MKKRLLLVAFVATPALAIFGVGDIVYDPNNFQEAVQELAQMAQQYEQLVETYHMVQSQYQQMLLMSKQDPVNMLARYRAPAVPWTPNAAADTYGVTSGWTFGVNSGQAVSTGYHAATESLASYGDALGNIPADQVNRLKTDYATVELTDGANLAGLQTIGDIRGNAPAVESAIQNLESDSLSPDPEMNTEVGVLNKINAANVLNVRNTQDTNKVLVALVEQQILQSKRERDAEARAFKEDIQFRSQAQAVLSAQAADASSAMLAWRMP